MIDQRHLHDLEQTFLSQTERPDQIEDLVVGAGSARLTLLVSPNDRMRDGTLASNFAFDVLGDVTQLAAASLAPDRHVSTEYFGLSKVRPAESFRALARARVTLYQGDMAVVTAVLIDDAGRPIATAHSLYRLIDEVRQPEPQAEPQATRTSPVEQVVWQTPFGPIFPN